MKRWRLKSLTVDRVDIVDNPANPLADMALIYKRNEYPTSDATVADTQHPEVSPVDDVNETPEVETDEAPEAQSDLEETNEATPEVVDVDEVLEVLEPVAASADEPVEKAETVDIEKAELKKALEDAQAEIAKMKHEARSAEYVAKAKSDLANLGNAAELGGLLLDAADNLSAESYQLLERTLKAANAQVESGDLFAQIGKADAEPAEAKATIYKMAEEMVAKGEAKNLGLALAEVVKQHPELRDEYYSAAERA